MGVTVFSAETDAKPREWLAPPKPKPDPVRGYGCPECFAWYAEHGTDAEFLSLYGHRFESMFESLQGEPIAAFERLEKLLNPVVEGSTKKDKPAVEDVAATLYELYCREVGGVAFNGDPLPGWRDFRDHPDKTKQSDAWMAVAAHAIEHLA